MVLRGSRGGYSVELARSKGMILLFGGDSTVVATVAQTISVARFLTPSRF
jgi:hypothetical protein